MGSPALLTHDSSLATRMMTAPPTKSEFRTQFRAFRDGLSEEAHRETSAAIVRQVRALPELDSAETVHAYWPQSGEHEVDTRPLIRSLADNGTRVVLPVVTSFRHNGTPPTMEHRVFTGEAHLTTNRWGLLEPAGSPRVSPQALDLVLAPALGAGRNGHRIGHGRGYYDAFLAAVNAPVAVLVYDACLVERVPTEPHDVPASIIVTEQDVLRPRRTA